MKSYWMNISEGQGQMELREVDMPVPGAGQVLVKLHAAALNRGELIIGHGLHGKGGSKPAGMEGAGQIVQLGSETGAWQVGDRVMGRCPGAFSEYALMDVREIMCVPDNLTLEQAASIPLTFLVTYDLLVLQGHLKADQWLLINGVSSGVGVASLQMAKVLGAKVIGTSGSQAKLDQLKPLGLDVGLCTRAADFHQAVLQATEQKGQIDPLTTAPADAAKARVAGEQLIEGQTAVMAQAIEDCRLCPGIDVLTATQYLLQALEQA